MPFWVHDNSGTKLDGHAKEGCWVGFNEQSKQSRVYWPEKHTVTVECSVTFTSPVVIDGLQGEELVEPKHLVKLPSLTPTVPFRPSVQSRVTNDSELNT